MRPAKVNPQEFRDREAGRACWVWAGGTSLADVDPAQMQGACHVATNHQVWAVEKLGFPMPDYWIFYDRVVPEDVAVDAYPEPSKWVHSSPAKLLARRGYTPSNHGKQQTYIHFAGNRARPITREAVGLQLMNSTLNGALHLAWILGCNPIHVRGMDLGPGPDGRYHWWEKQSRGMGGGLRKTYGRMAGYLRDTLTAIQNSGVSVTVGRDSPLFESFPATV